MQPEVLKLLDTAISRLSLFRAQILKESKISESQPDRAFNIDTLSDVTPYIEEMRNFTHVNTASRCVEPGLSRQDVRMLLKSHGVVLSLNTIRKRLDALVSLAILEKERSGRDYVYRVVAAPEEIEKIVQAI